MATALTTLAFLASIGVNVHTDQGYSASAYVAPLKFAGIGAARSTYGRIDASVLVSQQAGVKFAIAGECNIADHLAAARILKAAGGLLALEGPNEANNFPITYEGRRGGGSGSYLPVAQCMRDLIAAVAADPVLKGTPVYHASEGGAETDNVGLQFLTIPSGAGTLMPDGTKLADFANPHNYVIGNCHRYVDNQAWQAADPTLNGCWDSLYAEYGRTWRRGFTGYPVAQLATLPRVSTETGWDSKSDPGGETVQGKVLVNTYLAQFKRGWTTTYVYQLIDGEGCGVDCTNAQGIFRPDGTAKPAAIYIHNLTAVLTGGGDIEPTSLDYNITGQTETVHDLLLQKTAHTFDLIVWGEKVTGSVPVTVAFGSTMTAVNVYDVTAGTTPIASYTNISAVPMALSDHALIVECVSP